MKCLPIKILENLDDLGYGDNTIDVTLKAQLIKKNNSSAGLYLVSFKGTRKVATDWEKVLTKNMSDIKLLLKIFLLLS